MSVTYLEVGIAENECFVKCTFMNFKQVTIVTK